MLLLFLLNFMNSVLSYLIISYKNIEQVDLFN